MQPTETCDLKNRTNHEHRTFTHFSLLHFVLFNKSITQKKLAEKSILVKCLTESFYYYP